MSETRLPSEWLITNLEIIGEVVTGKTPSKKNSEYFGGAIPFIKPGDVNDQGNITFTEEHITELGASTVPTIPKESIVVTCIGNLGRCGITTERSATNQQINSVLPNRNVDVKFIYYQLRTLKEWMISESSATTVTIINKSKFSQAPLVLSPLAEQKVIADKLDTLLAQVDNTKARLERIPEILKSFRQSVLAAAVSGKLTEEWREQNSADKLKHVFLGDVIDGISQGWSPQCLSENTDESSWGVIKTSSVQEIVFLQNENKKLPPGLDARPELKVNEGDILTTRAGPRTRCGVTCYVEHVNLNLMLCDKVYRYRVNPQKGLSKYLALQLNEIAVLEQIELLKTGISESGMNLTQSKFKELTLTWPSLKEQSEIVRRVEELFAFADRIEQAAQAALSRVNNLTQSILAKAFRGELTADWRAANPDLITGDNSAEALLVKIKAERAKLSKKAKAKA